MMKIIQWLKEQRESLRREPDPAVVDAVRKLSEVHIEGEPQVMAARQRVRDLLAKTECRCPTCGHWHFTSNT